MIGKISKRGKKEKEQEDNICERLNMLCVWNKAPSHEDGVEGQLKKDSQGKSHLCWVFKSVGFASCWSVFSIKKHKEAYGRERPG